MNLKAPFLCFLLTSCVSSQEGDKIRDELFQIQTRVDDMESQLSQKKVQGDAANKRIASTGARLESIENDLRQIKGSLDTMSYSVKTGEIPGASPEEETIAKKIQQIQERLGAAEETQRLLLERITASAGNTGVKKAQAAPSEKGDEKKKFKNFKDLEEAYHKQAYTLIANEANALIDKLPKNQKTHGRYIYAESLFAIKRYSDAAIAYNVLIKDPVLKEKEPQMQFRLGFCFESLGDKDVAHVYYEELIKKHPQSKAAVGARHQLSRMKR